MDKINEYAIINEFGKYAEFDDLGVFIKWSCEKCTTPHKWAIKIISQINPGCRIEEIDKNKF